MQPNQPYLPRTVLIPLFTALAIFTLSVAGLRAAGPAFVKVDPLDARIEGQVVFDIAVQPDGKIIIGGGFESVQGVPRKSMARLNADGTLDKSFDPGLGMHSAVYAVTVQKDGKILLGGTFTTLQPNGAKKSSARANIARLHADGTLDETFDPCADNTVYTITVQPRDNKLLLGGNFKTLRPGGTGAPVLRNYLARLHPDGTPDKDFDPNPNDGLGPIVVQADGKILITGRFTGLQPAGTPFTARPDNLARLNADGSLDAAFDPHADESVCAALEQPDGKILLAGYFRNLQPNGAAAPVPRLFLARVNADGSLDAAFDPRPNWPVDRLALQADGKILVAGSFSSFQPEGAKEPVQRNSLARLFADGKLDPTLDLTTTIRQFEPGFYSIVVQPDGKVLLGGTFPVLYPPGKALGVRRNSFARLADPPPPLPRRSRTGNR